MRVTNGLKFSYPGYNETLCGFPDPRIDRNEYGPNPNVTVLEWLNRKPAFQGRVAARRVGRLRPHFEPWALRVLRQRRIRAHAGGRCQSATTTFEPAERRDPANLGRGTRRCLTFHSALEYFKEHRPRVFFLSLGRNLTNGGTAAAMMNTFHRPNGPIAT